MDDAALAEQIREAWGANQRINLLLVDRISDDGLLATLSKRGGRTVGRQLAHLHDNRVWQLQNRARELSVGLETFASKDEPERDTLRRRLEASAERIETFLLDILAGRPKRRGFKRGVVAHLAYLVAHESHHRGNILLTLKQTGHPLDKTTAYAIWNWDKI